MFATSSVGTEVTVGKITCSVWVGITADSVVGGTVVDVTVEVGTSVGATVAVSPQAVSSRINNRVGMSLFMEYPD